MAQKVLIFAIIALIIRLLCSQPIANYYEIVGGVLDLLFNLTSLPAYILTLYPDRQLEIILRRSFDFIIIGSSPSGCVLANRLTENASTQVLLLENGLEASKFTDIPVLAGYFGSTVYSYGYVTEQQPGFCRGCTGHRLQWEHGNALGGSTVINYMIYVRGNRRDYDDWAALGNDGWSYNDILPYLKKIETVNVKIHDDNYRGTRGYLTISDVAWRSQLSEIYVNASQEAGYSYVDYNGRQQLGVSYIQTTTKNGRRETAESVYLRPIRSRFNLNVKTRSKVTKILIHPETKIAYGVEYVNNGIRYEVYAKKEVILSAGALNSPQVLMLSGIGPREDLESFGIPVINGLLVGRKMYDHVNFPLILYRLNESVSINADRELLNPLSVPEFLVGRGFLTSIGGVEAVTYIKTNMSTDPDPLYPDVELLMIGGSIANDHGIALRNMFNIPTSIYNTFFKPLEGQNVYQVTPVVLHPKSFGSIKLRSSNPFDAPLFYANFFSDPDNHDIRTMIAGIREFQRINASPALQRVGATLVNTPVPGCEGETFDSDQYWECAIRTVCGSYFHMVHTCKMGPANDTEAVVDNNLRVHGVGRLRVVDTSVMPITTAAHNMAPGYVIGEKAADIIKQFWNI